MTWRTYYDSVVGTLSQMRGQGTAKDPVGQPLPLLMASDMCGILASVSDRLVAAVKRQNEGGDDVPLASTVEDDGTRSLAGSVLGYLGEAGAANYEDHCSAQAYIAGVGQGDTPWIRAVNYTDLSQLTADQRSQLAAFGFSVDTSDPSSPSLYTPYARSSNTNNLSFLRSTMAAWQRCIDASVRALQLNGLGNPSPDDTSAFFAAFGSLCDSLDVLAETAPTDLSSDIAGALNESLKKSAEAAGQLTGAVANAAGQAAGSFGEGFLKQASMITLIVTGFVVYWFVVR